MKVPDTFVAAPTVNTGVPVSVMPLLPAVMAVASVAAAVVVVTLTVADARLDNAINSAGHIKAAPTMRLRELQTETPSFKDLCVFKIFTHLHNQLTPR